MTSKLHNVEIEFVSSTGETVRASMGTTYLSEAQAERTEKAYGTLVEQRGATQIRKKGTQTYFLTERKPYLRFIGPDGKEYVDISS